MERIRTNVTVTLDVELKIKARQQNINLSELLAKALKQKFAIMEEDINSIDMQLLQKELEREEKKLNNQNTTVMNLRERMCILMEKKEEEERQRLEIQKKAIEEAKKCKQCGVIITDETKQHQFKIGKICNSCYMGATTDQYKNWVKN